MENNLSIKVENVSKKYCKSLKRSMFYGVKDITRNSLGLTSNSHILRKGEFWALDDISFEVRKGETLGIIGANGAGKTTILKLLNGIFWPDKGKITIKGKTGALIAVGAGFHPMLSGRENIYLNGAILGMNRQEIDNDFDKIVKFADIGDFLDTPVKFYSSGMFVRLGFAIAVYCNPDILLVDEVLSVGDLEFRLKCRREISRFIQKDKTAVIISHNMNTIRNVSDRVIWLDKGKIIEMGEVDRVCRLYEEHVIANKKNQFNVGGRRLNYDPSVKISKVEFLDSNNQIRKSFKVGEHFKIRIHFKCVRTVKKPVFRVVIFNPEGLNVSANNSDSGGNKFSQIYGTGYVDFYIDKLSLNPSKYVCNIAFSEKEFGNFLDFHEKCYGFNVAGGQATQGLINSFPKWSLKQGKKLS